MDMAAEKKRVADGLEAELANVLKQKAEDELKLIAQVGE
jgi:hypothetical protein